MEKPIRIPAPATPATTPRTQLAPVPLTARVYIGPAAVGQKK